MPRILIGALAALALVPAVAIAGPARPDVPDAIAVTDGSKPYLVTHATGVQIYSCDGTAWRFVAPRADLLDDHGKVIGTHSAGPIWQTRDGSFVRAARDAGINVDASAIDWLRLKRTDSAGERLGATRWIQRIATVGGVTPAAAGCHAGTAGVVQEVPYTADYVFWK